MPSAPPEPPSPMTAAMMGTSSSIISRKLTAMASAMWRSSAPTPGYAPAVSMSVMIGRPNLFASRIKRSALR